MKIGSLREKLTISQLNNLEGLDKNYWVVRNAGLTHSINTWSPKKMIFSETRPSFLKEAAHINLAEPSEIAIKASTPFFDQRKFVQFSVYEQKYLPLSNDVIRNVLILFRHRYINIICIQDFIEENGVEIPMCKDSENISITLFEKEGIFALILKTGNIFTSQRMEYKH